MSHLRRGKPSAAARMMGSAAMTPSLPMPGPQPLELLHYLPAHRVVICKECHYAIQPSAISRHLKELHHIYRADRQVYTDYALTLDLADPIHVIPPEPHHPPVPFLPVEKGVACSAVGCAHLCVTTKRMKQHWATVHKQSASEVRWHPVSLQTFFRGNQLRYFVVDVESTLPSPTSSASPSLPALQASHGPPVLPSFNFKNLDLSNLDLNNLDLNNLDLNAEFVYGEPHYRRMLATHGHRLGVLEDRELLRHFMTSTYTSFGDTLSSREAWLTWLIDRAFVHSFLMHGLLACAATHLASLSSSAADRQRYELTAAQHHAIALPVFRAAISAVDEHNCEAIIAFSQVLIVLMFALQDHDENLLLVRQADVDELPDWMIVIRGGCTLFLSTWSLVMAGPMRPLLKQEDHSFQYFHEPDAARCLDHLYSFPFPESDDSGRDSSYRSPSTFTNQASSRSTHYSPSSGPSMSHSPHLGPGPYSPTKSRKQTYHAALNSLRNAFIMASALRGHLTVRSTLHIWPTDVSQAYLSLLRLRDPAALVLLAHWAVLLKPLEKSWYMTGVTTRLMRGVWNELLPDARAWLAWPLSELGLSEQDF